MPQPWRWWPEGGSTTSSWTQRWVCEHVVVVALLPVEQRRHDVVLSRQVTGKKLLEKGELQRRYTIIPLNKISAKTLDDRVIRAAKSLVRGPHTAPAAATFNLWMSSSRLFPPSSVRSGPTTSTQPCPWWATSPT